MGRLKNMFAALRGAPLRDPLPSTTSFFMGMGAFDTRPIKTKKSQSEAYLGWVYGAVSAIAEDVRSVPWRLLNDKNEEQPIPGILKRPTAFQTISELFEATQQQLDLTGEAFWWLVTSGSTVTGIQLIYSWWVQEPIIEDGFFKGWRVNIPGSATQDLPFKDVIWIKYPNPVDPWRGASPVEAFALSYDMDLHSRAYGAALMKNWAQPPGILTTSQPLTSVQANEIRTSWKAQRQQPENIAVLGQGTTYQQLSITIKDLAFLDLARLTREQILGIYRVPASRLGLSEEGGTRAEHEARDVAYKESSIRPRLNRIEDAINVYLLERLSPLATREVARIRFEFTDPVRRDQSFDLVKANDGLSKGVITIDDYLRETNREPLPNGQGKLFMLPSGVTLVANLEDGLTTNVSLPGSGEDPDEEDAPEDLEGGDIEEENEEGRGIFIPDALLPKYTQKDFELATHRYLKRQTKLEVDLRSDVRALFTREGKALSKAIREGAQYSREYLVLTHDMKAAGDMWSEVLEQRDVVDDVLNEFAEEWIKTMRAAMELGLEDGWELLASDAGRTLLDFSVFEPAAERIASRHAAERIVDIHKTTRKEIRRTIATAIREGKSVGAIAQRVTAAYDVFKGGRAFAIARTETAWAISRGRDEHATRVERELKVKVIDTWLAVNDDRTRDHHADADGQTIEHGQLFTVGGELMAHPLDAEHGATAKNIINCRCTLISEIQDAGSQ